jgi:hypothetical protein
MTKETSYVTQPQLSVYNWVFVVKQTHVPKMQEIFGRQKVEHIIEEAKLFALFMGYFKTFYQLMMFS